MHEADNYLRYYIQLLLKRWGILAIAVFLAVFGASVVTLTTADKYEAESTIAMLRSRTEVEFDPRIRTLSDYELANAGISARQDALMALVTGNQVVQRVLDDIGEHLDADERNIKNLREMVETETAGDLININVQHEDPEVAALIANSWAKHYEQYVNSVYSSSPVIGSNVADQVAAAEQHYNETQQTLEAFTAEEQILMLEREIASREAQLQSFRQALMRIQVIPTDTNQALLRDYYRELQQVENWLVDATSLREQVAHDSNSAAAELGNTVALLMLRARIFGTESNSLTTDSIVAAERNRAETQSQNQTPVIPAAGNQAATSGPAVTLQLDLSNPPESSVSTADVDAMIEILEQRREDAQARIDSLVGAINSGAAPSELSSTESEVLGQVTTLEAEIAALQSEVEAQTATRRELEQARDRAWDTYQVLVGRQVEQEIISESPAAEVRIADTAIVPTEPVSRGLLQNTALAGLAAFMLSVGAIIAWDWWKSGEVEFPERGRAEVSPEAAEPDDAGHAEVPSAAPGHAGQLSDSVT